MKILVKSISKAGDPSIVLGCRKTAPAGLIFLIFLIYFLQRFMNFDTLGKRKRVPHTNKLVTILAVQGTEQGKPRDLYLDLFVLLICFHDVHCVASGQLWH